jgi:hypothetical protein
MIERSGAGFIPRTKYGAGSGRPKTYGSGSDSGSAALVKTYQLFLVVRAILSPAKIILVDEATANVDAATDLQVQKVRAIRIVIPILFISKKPADCDLIFLKIWHKAFDFKDRT